MIVVEESTLGEPWQTIAGIGNWAIWLAFAFESAVMLYVVPKRWEWIKQNPFSLPIVILTPPFAPAILQASRAFRLGRLFRLAGSFRLIRRYFNLEGLKWAAVLTVFLVLAAGTAFAAIENGKGGQDLSPWDGFWWALTTITTGGFGDIRPQTDAGRVIAIVLIVTGVGFVVMLTAAMAQMFVARGVQEDVQTHEDHVIAELREVRDRLDRIERRLS